MAEDRTNQDVILTDIPEDFQCDLTDEPFTQCVMCERDLSGQSIPYLIEKAYKRYPGTGDRNTVFEYAICLDCSQKMNHEMSRDSREAVDNYIMERVDLEQRRQQLMEEKGHKPNEWMNTCMIKGTPISELQEYNIYGQFVQNKLMFTYMPFVIGQEALEEMAELLSAKTKGEIDDFMDDNLGPSPELKELLKDRTPVLL